MFLQMNLYVNPPGDPVSECGYATYTYIHVRAHTRTHAHTVDTTTHTIHTQCGMHVVACCDSTLLLIMVRVCYGVCAHRAGVCVCMCVPASLPHAYTDGENEEENIYDAVMSGDV